MARLHGKSGSVTLSTGYASHCKEWTMDRQVDEADGTELGFVNKNTDPGMASASGTVTFFVDDTTSVTDTPISATLVLKHSSSKTFTIKALLTKFSTKASPDGNSEYTFNWTIGGTLATGAATDFVIA